VDPGAGTHGEFLNHLYVRQDCLIPLWVRDQRAGSTRLEKIPPLFRKINYLDLRTEQAFEASMPGLIDRIRSISVFEQQEALEGPARDSSNGPEAEQGSFSEAFAILCGRLCIAAASPSGERPLGLAWVEAHCYVALPRRPSEPGADIVWIRPAMEGTAGSGFEAKRLRHQTRAGWLSYHTDLLAPLPAAAQVHAPGSGVSRELGMVYLSGEPDEPTLDYSVVLVTEWGREGGLKLGGALEGDPAVRYGALLFDRSAALVGSAWQRGELWIAQPFA
jgi:hypothetical protein